jgi:hypothetical protein
VIGLIEPLADSWKQIRGDAAAQPATGLGA